MKKLKLVLLFSLVLYVYIITSNLIYKTNYQEGYIELIGVIHEINIKNDKIDIVLNAKEKILVSYYSDNCHYKLGDKVKIMGQLNKPSINSVFNLFNYRNYLLSKKIYFHLKADSVEKVSNNDNWFFKIKNSIIDKINTYKSSTYLKTFILGDQSEINNNMKLIYQENGINHLLAISGMQVTLYANLMLFILNKVFKKGNHMLVSIFLMIYAFLTNLMPSIVRAVLFFTFSKLKLNRFDLMMIIAGMMLIYNPYYIYNVGFVFSFLISLFLINYGYLIEQYKNYLIKLLVTSLICFLVSIPILINNFFTINLMSPIINIFFVPYVSFIIFPISLLTICFPIFDPLLLILVNFLEYSSIVFNNININLIFSKVPFIIFILYYVIIVLVLNKSKYIYLLIIFMFIHYNIRLFMNNSYLTMIDVGQGDSILLEIKGGAILIDTGGVFTTSNYSMAISKTIPYLKSLGIKNLDYLIITHGDHDHIGEAWNLVSNFKVNEVIFNSGNNNDLELKLINLLDIKKIRYQFINKGKIIYKKHELHFINDKDILNENEDSLVLYTKIANQNILFMGDTGKETEKYLLNTYNLSNMDILKVGHHGSKNSSDQLFIKKTTPKISLISAGLNNQFKHPHQEVIDSLDNINSLTYVTSINGSIRINLSNLKVYTCSY